MKNKWLKADLHLHTNKDPMHPSIKYNPKQLIDFLAKKGYDVAAITHHDDVYFNKDIKNYAKKKGVLLIPGCERTINNAHVLLLNIDKKIMKRIKTFADLKREREKNPDMFVIAAHPYYPYGYCLYDDLEKHIELFDAVEFSHFFSKLFSFNKKATMTARRYSKPLIGTSDAHLLEQIGNTYTLINAKKNKKSVLSALKKGNVKHRSRPLPFLLLAKWISNLVFYEIKDFLKNKFFK